MRWLQKIEASAGALDGFLIISATLDDCNDVLCKFLVWWATQAGRMARNMVRMLALRASCMMFVVMHIILTLRASCMMFLVIHSSFNLSDSLVLVFTYIQAVEYHSQIILVR